MTQLTQPYRIDRYRLVMLGMVEYLRGFWWFIVPVPIFGVIALITGSGYYQALGLIALLWPLTLPSRAFLASSRASRIFSRSDVEALLDDDNLYFRPTNGDKGSMLARAAIRDVVRRGEWYLVRTRRLGVIPIPAASVIESARATLESLTWQTLPGQSDQAAG